VGVLFGRERRNVFPEPIIAPYPGGPTGMDGGGSPATGTTAFQVPAVWNCVSLIAGSVAMLPLQTFRQDTDGIPRRITDPPLIAKPGMGMTQSEWLHQVMVSLLYRGNAVGRYVARDGFGRPTQIKLMHPDSVTIATDHITGRITYKMGPQQVEVPTEDVFHVKGMCLPGASEGLSPISYAAATLGIDLNSRKFASDFFAAGGIPNGVIESDQEITQDQAKTIKDRWRVATAAREVAVMGAGAKYAQISVKPEESQFLATQKDNLSQIARYFTLDPSMIGGPAGSSMTYSNVEQKFLQYLIVTINPWLKRIEDAMFPLLSQPSYVQFDTKALLRTDAETRAKIHNQAIAGRWKTPTEVRFDENLPPMTKAQKTEVDLVPLVETPLGGVKALPGLKDPLGPAAPTPVNDQTGTLPNG
jgi:HK97 family phage portal protein